MGDTIQCDKCKNVFPSKKVQPIIKRDNTKVYMCDGCVKKLQRKWTDWYSK